MSKIFTPLHVLPIIKNCCPVLHSKYDVGFLYILCGYSNLVSLQYKQLQLDTVLAQLLPKQITESKNLIYLVIHKNQKKEEIK